MKKIRTIGAIVLAVSAIGGSAYASSDSKIDESMQASIATVAESVSMTDSTAAISGDDATKVEDSTNFDKMAKEKGISLEKLFSQLEKEGKLTNAVISTESEQAAASSEYALSSNVESSETVNLEEMAKEKGITVKELIDQLEKEGKLTKAAELTDSVPAEKDDETVNLEEMAKEKGITVEALIDQLEKEGKLTKAEKLTDSVPTEKGDETVNLEEMAKEKGITVEALIDQLEKEGKLTKAEKLTDSISAEKDKK